MRKASTVFPTVILLCLLPALLSAGERKIPITVAFTHHKLGIPFLSSSTGLRLFPGFMVGTEVSYVDRDRFDLVETIVLSGSFHPDSPYGNVFSLGTEIVPRFPLKNGLYFDTLAGLHYSHVFSNIATLRVSEETVEQKRDWGRANFMFNLGFAAGYDFSVLLDVPIRLFLRCDMGLIYGPSRSFGILNLLPATTLMVGTQILL